MRRNRFADPCIECKKHTPPDGGFLFGTSNAVVCIGCLVDFYGREHGYFAPLQQSPGLT